jgi:hypothetical protein
MLGLCSALAVAGWGEGLRNSKKMLGIRFRPLVLVDILDLPDIDSEAKLGGI